jgi:hypothetical protein
MDARGIMGAQQVGGVSSAYGHTQGATIPQPPEPTLVSAMSSLDELNKRLGNLTAHAHEVAHAVGGPYPAAGTGGKEASVPASAMARLNSTISTAHQQVGDLEGAMSAIRRSLGS